MSIMMSARRTSDRLDPRFLFEILVCDLHATAIAVGLTLQKMRRLPHDKSVRHLLHEDSQVTLFALRYRNDMALPDALGEAMARLYIELGAARQALRDVVLALERPGEALIRQWQDLAERALATMRDLSPRYDGRLDKRYSHDARIIIDFLAASHRGARELAPPRLAQRRGAPRLKASSPCRILLGGGDSYAARLLDVSRTGASVATSAPARVHDIVDIDVAGRRYTAQLVIASPERWGLRLLQSLSLSDQLLKAAT